MTFELDPLVRDALERVYGGEEIALVAADVGCDLFFLQTIMSQLREHGRLVEWLERIAWHDGGETRWDEEGKPHPILTPQRCAHEALQGKRVEDVDGVPNDR